MDRQDPLLSHQYEAVTALATKFEKVTVITGKLGSIESNPKVQIINTNWAAGRPLSNMLKLLLRSLQVIAKNDFHSVFFHMTDLQAAFISPIMFFMGKRQYLWYAHTFKSKYLTFASLWVTKVVTSTPGSCPLKSSKVKAIGQAIDEKNFAPIPFQSLDLNKLIHIGRFDKSKNIDLLIEAVQEIRKIQIGTSLTLVGTPANFESKAWAAGLISGHQEDIQKGWLRFDPSIPRQDFRKVIQQNGCFFHGYRGSLDKTLVESTMLRVPVITINPEYQSIFGSWAKSGELNLVDEYFAMRSLSNSELENELEKRLAIARSEHSLNHWINELSSVLER
jgi:glycosyltransferase involved in cell wall biosynthesis